MMYEINRAIYSWIALGFFLLFQLLFWPYKGRTNNLLAIAFSVCDILGTVAALPVLATPALQIFFLVLTLILTIVCVVLLLRSVCSRNRRHIDLNFGAGYSRRQKIFLAPVLAVVWVWQKMMKVCDRDRDRPSAVVVPAAIPAATTEEDTRK